jgi:hypothetical protein
MGWTLQEVLHIWQQREDDEIPPVLPMAAESMARAVEDEARLAMAEARRTLRAGEAGETWPEDAA